MASSLTWRPSQYGNLYLMFATFPDIFPSVYGFSSGITGLMYLGFGIGFLLATIFGATFSNTVYNKVSFSAFDFWKL